MARRARRRPAHAIAPIAPATLALLARLASTPLAPIARLASTPLAPIARLASTPLALLARLASTPLAPLALAALAACDRGSDPGRHERLPEPSTASAQAHTQTLARAQAQAPPPRFVRGPTGGRPVAPAVAAELRRAPPGQRVLVYVGAKWCEPCRRFHDAVERRELDRDLAGLVLVEFDHDADEPALESAGYTYRLLPLFAVPAADGRATDRKIAGSVKGPEAVGEITPRLRALLAGTPDR